MSAPYNPTKMVSNTLARAEDVNRELVKIQAAFEQLQAFLEGQITNPPSPQQLFTWRAYANSADGLVDFTTGGPGTRTYLGLAFNKLVETPSQFPADYEWSLIAGTIGNFVSSDTSTVAGRPSTQIVSDLDTLALQVLAYQFDRQTLQDYVNARLFVDGEPVNTVIVEERNERQTADTALAETVGLIGAKTLDGSAFIIDLNKTYVSPTISLGVRLGQIQSQADGTQASVQALQQTIAEGGFAEASDLALLGAKTVDGQAFQMNLGTVKVSPSQTLAQYISSVAASAAGNAVSVQQIFDATITPTGGAAAKAVLSLDVNGRVVGYTATNSGTTGSIKFKFDSFELQDPAGNSLFTAAGGIVKMHAVEVDTIKIGSVGPQELATNAAVKPATVTAGTTIVGAGGGVWIDALSLTITLDKAATLFAQVVASQGFPNGDKQYGNQLLINGSVVFSVGGLKTLDSATLAGSLALGPGTYTVLHRWSGDPTTRLFARTLFVMAIY